MPVASRQTQRKNLKNVLHAKILATTQDGLSSTIISGKQRGVVTTQEFKKGEFVVEYIGELIDSKTAKIRESNREEYGDYMFYFRFSEKNFCNDASAESNRLGRLINHSRENKNIVPRIVNINSIPHVCFFAAKDIQIGTELLYDYNDRRPEIIKIYPWLNE